jgi:undecaprenyl-diphosphatase
MARVYPAANCGKPGRVLVLFVLLLTALAAGGLVVAVGFAFPAVDVTSPAIADNAGDVAERTVGRHPRVRHLVAARLDPRVATGLALSLALVVALLGAFVLGVLAYLVRSSAPLRHLDSGVERWGHVHAGPVSTQGLNLVTNLGTWWVVIPLATAIALVEHVRVPNRWIAPFLLVLMGGEEAITVGVKQLVNRTRPTLNPIAATLGPSFPSGHSATAAAFYAGIALLLARRRQRVWRMLLAGGAVAVAVAVAASRVLLDVHWLSDVIAGVMVGWAWFAISSIAFGGRLLQFGAPAEQVVSRAKASERVEHGVRGAGSSRAGTT